MFRSDVGNAKLRTLVRKYWSGRIILQAGRLPRRTRASCEVKYALHLRRRAGVLIHFGPFTLDSSTRQLTRAAQPIHLSPKAYELLTVLVRSRPAALSKAELQRTIWPDTYVVEANLSNLVAEVRAALGDSARAPTYVRTVHTFGYAFCAAAQPHQDDRTAPAAAALAPPV